VEKEDLTVMDYPLKSLTMLKIKTKEEKWETV